MPYCGWMKREGHAWSDAGEDWEQYDNVQLEDARVEQLSDDEAQRLYPECFKDEE